MREFVNDELKRYHEYLQSQLLSSGWEEWFTATNYEKWFDADGMAKLAECQGLAGTSLREFLRERSDFRPTTKFDRPDIPLIFQPLLDRIHAAAKRTGWAVKLPITVVTSTDVSPSPFARPGDVQHTLFIGMGTGKFCNCWAKAFTNVALAVWKDDPDTKVPRIPDVLETIRRQPRLISFSFYLAMCYARQGSVADVEQEIPAIRAEAVLKGYLLDAMELFVVAHEYAHFIAHERRPEFAGSSDPTQSIELEKFCDSVGVFLSRAAATEPWNQLAFSGAGGLVFLRSLQLCEYARDLVHAREPSQSHPSCLDRIGAIVKEIQSTEREATRDACIKIIKGYDMIALGQFRWLGPLLHWTIKKRLPTYEELDAGSAPP